MSDSYLRAHPELPDTRTAQLNAEAAAVRLTAAQRDASLAVLLDRGSYPSMEALADALALAVITAEDDSSRRVVCVYEPGGAFYVFGPYATQLAAEKAAVSGLATRDGARGGIFPLSLVPKAVAPAKVKQAGVQRRAVAKKAAADVG